MTMQEAISKCELYREPVSHTEVLIDAINTIEWKIKREIIDRTEDASLFPFEGYTEDDIDDELLAPEPYSVLYVYWLIYQTDLMKGNETVSDSYSKFKEAYTDFGNYFIREHMPVAAPNTHSIYLEMI